MTRTIIFKLAAVALALSAASAVPQDSTSWFGQRLGAPAPPTEKDFQPAIGAPAPWDRIDLHAPKGVVSGLHFIKIARSEGDAASFERKRIAEITRRFGQPEVTGTIATWRFTDPAHPERGPDTVGFDDGKVIRSAAQPEHSGTPSDPMLAGVSIWHLGRITEMFVASHDAYVPPAPIPPPPPPPTPENPYVVDLNRAPSCPVHYPPAALRAEAQGRATARFVIDDAHRMTSCAIVSGAGSVDLDNATCRYMKCAADDAVATGQPWNAGEDTKSMTWHIPS